MMQYVNRYTCATNNAKNEFVLNFYQQAPAIDENGSIIDSLTEPVSSLVMTMDCALSLMDTIKALAASDPNMPVVTAEDA